MISLLKVLSSFLTQKEADTGQTISVLLPTRINPSRFNMYWVWDLCWNRKKLLHLIEKDPRNRDVMFPYLNGEDLNSRPDQSPSRWVINFHNWPLEQAEMYPDCIKIVREKVKPERDKNNRISRDVNSLVVCLTRRATGLYATIAEMKRVLAIALTSRTLAFTFVPTNIVFSHAVVVIAFDTMSYFAVLQSSCSCGMGFYIMALR